ncbi:MULTISPECIES: signal peptide peptidase SppA [Corallococcus]|uniref:signal peptide peptidase SppA n=1 Tax=Corallococcus TaxID=83461 RepID=UPI00117D700B|nr:MULTISPECIES: signal peptide peptidase SppA [Corallococcus]NBD12825.1 signal peptide peptidase SppA [Corallococcus silvisoli]TSC23108.1 signal peptide peptidase SppA [Corallococcus sp. Z5C101001]
MKRFFIGALAFIGALSILFVVGVVGLLMLASASKPSVPSNLVLELDLKHPLPEYTLDTSLAGAFGDEPTTLRDVVEALGKAGTDPRVKALVVRVGQPGSAAQVQELRDAVKAFRATGKRAVAYADGFGEAGNGTGAYYLASAFDSVYIQPSGDVDVTGLLMETPFARDAFAKVGVKPEFGKRAEYKNAVNTFTDESYGAPQREATEAYGGSLFSQIVKGVAEGRKLSEDEVRAIIDRAPYMGQQAVDAKLVDGLRYRDEIYDELKQQAGDGAKFLYVDKYLERAGRPYQTGTSIALIFGVGEVLRGKSQSNPLSGSEVMGGDTVAAAFRKAVEDPSVKAILFRVDSPGGSYSASDTIRREVQRAREAGKPVIVSMGTYAASGGYFVAMAGDKIVAQPGTLTGSIGVYNGKFVTSELWAKLGVNWDTISFGKNATFSSSDSEFTPEQRAKMESQLDTIYLDFTSRAAQARNMPLEKLQEVAKGRVWTGEDALARGLVDALGGYPKALELVREAAKLEKDAPLRIVVFPRPKPTGQVLSELLGKHEADNSDDDAAGAQSAVAPQVLEQVRAVYRVGAKLGLGEEGVEGRTLYAPMPELRW